MYPPTNVLELEGQAQDWEKLIIYAKAAWKWAIEQIKISIFFEAAMFQGFDKTWGDMNVLCRRHNLHLKWNQKRQHSQVVKPSLEGNLGSMGLVLGMWGGRGPWFAGSRGMSLARVGFLLLFTWQCFTFEDSHLPSVWTRFHVFNSFWHWPCWHYVSNFL